MGELIEFKRPDRPAPPAFASWHEEFMYEGILDFKGAVEAMLEARDVLELRARMQVVREQVDAWPVE